MAEDKDIYIKLIEIQNELHAPKNQYNGYAGFNYRSCEDILEAVKPLCKERDLLLYLTDEVVTIGDRYYIRATAILTDGNKEVVVTAYAREEETKKGMDGSQITGSSSSYARKYALNGLFCIDDNKDADTNEQQKQKQAAEKQAEKQQPKQQKQQPIICPHCNKTVQACKTAKGTTWQPAQIMKKYGMCKECYLKKKLENEVKE